MRYVHAVLAQFDISDPYSIGIEFRIHGDIATSDERQSQTVGSFQRRMISAKGGGDKLRGTRKERGRGKRKDER